MAALAERLTFAEFQLKYDRGDRSFEYWYGEAIPKGMSTWIHGLLQTIISHLLLQAGYKAGGEVELRIIPEAHPKPDVIATRRAIEDPYPTSAVEVVVEILSKDDPMPFTLEKCQTYQAWGFEQIYLVDPASRKVFRWNETGLEISNELTSIPVAEIWAQLDRAIGPTESTS